MKEHYDVGVVGCWYWGNYGSLLNGYATYSILKSIGLKPLNIISPYNGFEPHAKKFFETVYNDGDISELLPFERLNEFNDLCDSFLTGSDQIWNYKQKDNIRYDKYFRLDFADDKKRKVSFATSFGNYQKESDDVHKIFKDLYGRYNAISVREQEGVDILKNIYGIKATQVLEPVLSVPVECWYDIALHSEYNENQDYILTYILDPTEEKRKAIQYYSSKAEIKAINILDGFSGAYKRNFDALNLSNTMPNVWCADLLKYFSKASFVITDSFHGVCFAIAFNKPFIAIGNYGRGIKRFETLLNKLGIKDRLIYDSKNIVCDEKYLQSINYDDVNNIIKLERERTVEWLKNAMLTPIEKMSSVILKDNITSRLDKKDCVGCGTCVNICPVNALDFTEDEYGYYKAKVNEQLCVECRKCIEFCPSLNPIINDNKDVPECYEFIAQDEDLLFKSSSGGAFSLIASRVLSENGIVYGAAWKEDFSVEHIRIDNISDLYKLQKSKYLQSYIGNIFASVKNDLLMGRKVVFSGCPCQIAGLKAFLNKDYENLFLIELLCGNAPSAWLFKKYIKDIFGDTVKKYEFRNKKNGYNGTTVKIEFKDGNIKYLNGYRQDYYQRVYHNHIMTPKHCEKCKFQSVKRLGDITIGDFWWLEKYDKAIETKDGINLLLINNDKGDKLIKDLSKDNVKLLKNVPIEWTGGNAQTRKGVFNGASSKRDLFYSIIRNMDFKEAVDYVTKPNHGLYKKSNEKELFTFITNRFGFKYDRNIWEQHIINDRITLITRPKNPDIGNYATLFLNTRLKMGVEYVLNVKFMIRTEDKYYNFHVKDSGSNLFQKIYVHNIVSEQNGKWVEKEIVFTPDSDLYDEFMIGAAQLKGEDAYISFEYICINELQENEN